MTACKLNNMLNFDRSDQRDGAVRFPCQLALTWVSEMDNFHSDSIQNTITNLSNTQVVLNWLV